VPSVVPAHLGCAAAYYVFVFPEVSTPAVALPVATELSVPAERSAAAAVAAVAVLSAAVLAAA